MNRSEHLLVCLAEECCEVGQRVSKALRFGLDEVQRDQPLNNAERITEEMHDLISVAAILHREGLIPGWLPDESQTIAKREKIERYMRLAVKKGALIDALKSEV